MQSGGDSTTFGEPGEVMYLPFIGQRIYVGEEVPRCLLADDDRIAAGHAQEWKKRRNPVKAQYRCQRAGSKKIRRR